MVAGSLCALPMKLLTIITWTWVVEIQGSASQADVEHGDAGLCPLPPEQSHFKPELRTALASHPRAGSTWTRYLVERATGLPCGFESPKWANILPHRGEDSMKPEAVNKDGVLVKTHSSCYGCWSGSDLADRFTVERNTTFDEKQLRAAVGANFAKEIMSSGCCLIMPPDNLQSMLERSARPRHREKMQRLPCRDTYDRAVVLFRNPLDNVRSNYHYRTAVLGMRPGNSWAANQHGFPRERMESWLNFYRTWSRFAEKKPVLWVLYENLKANPAAEIRRILDFLGFHEVPQSQIECAVNASTIDKLRKEDTVSKGQSPSFFGSRGSTEEKEALSFPPKLLRYFERIGVFEASRQLGYEIHGEYEIKAPPVAPSSRFSERTVKAAERDDL
eukprot:TRINITY_DN22651_c0_g1_i1.p1 TRINITY_DN22651_c0_g1~~TRINITY_DN22651_c0_g1_i1.p1  ORF type:complete len:389 (-),score=37.39 TRINITY_DN22651_c0_g1_i1:438-1604(-)